MLGSWAKSSLWAEAGSCCVEGRAKIKTREGEANSTGPGAALVRRQQMSRQCHSYLHLQPPEFLKWKILSKMNAAFFFFFSFPFKKVVYPLQVSLRLQLLQMRWASISVLRQNLRGLGARPQRHRSRRWARGVGQRGEGARTDWPLWTRSWSGCSHPVSPCGKRTENWKGETAGFHSMHLKMMRSPPWKDWAGFSKQPGFPLEKLRRWQN